MRTEVRTLYSFNELEADAQQRAIDGYRDRNADWLGTDWDSEWIAARRKFLALMRAETSRDGIFVTSTRWDDDVKAMEGARLWKFLQREVATDIEGECPFTGTCCDESYLRPLRKFLARPTRENNPSMRRFEDDDITALAAHCLEAGDRDWEADREYQCSDESIRERLADDVDGIEYTVDGKAV